MRSEVPDPPAYATSGNAEGAADVCGAERGATASAARSSSEGLRGCGVANCCSVWAARRSDGIGACSLHLGVSGAPDGSRIQVHVRTDTRVGCDRRGLDFLRTDIGPTGSRSVGSPDLPSLEGTFRSRCDYRSKARGNRRRVRQCVCRNCRRIPQSAKVPSVVLIIRTSGSRPDCLDRSG